MRGEERASGELTTFDKHAQAAMILSMCWRVLSPLQMAYVTVEFGRDTKGFDLWCSKSRDGLVPGSIDVEE